MATCSVRWRSSGGRGEFEFVPADSLEDREVQVFLEDLNLTIPAEVRGERKQGKPRLRKHEGNNRQKLHLPDLVMAIARLPAPAREDVLHAVTFPLQSKSFVMDAMDFDIIEDDGLTVTLAPLRVSIRNAQFQVELQDRIKAIADDLQNLPMIASKHPALAAAIEAHGAELKKAVNSLELRKAADAVNDLQAQVFGLTNAGSATKLEEAAARPPVELEEEIFGVEGKLLTRIHVYKERDKAFAARAKKFYRDKSGGKLCCEACGMDPLATYGPDGERCLEAHHRVPIEELQPDSITRVDEMAIVCASCHRIIHSKKPCLSVADVAKLVASDGADT
jgi:predicted HNH restriction endonuclease